jgi:uncharacterized protein YjbJ (UPF0337 family)
MPLRYEIARCLQLALGKVHEIKGKVKEKVKEKAGQLTNNPDLEGEGPPCQHP